MSNLKVLVFGTERSGTTSVTRVLENFFKSNDCDWSVSHETDEYPLYSAVKKWTGNGDDTPIRNILSHWNHQADVSTNVGVLLPLMAELFGSDLKIIYLVRPRDQYVPSVQRMAERFPKLYGGYVDDGLVGRPTAVDYGEMTENQWQALSVAERFGWWHDHYNKMAQQHLSLFDGYVRFETADLDKPETLVAIRDYINPNWKISFEPIRLNCQDVFNANAISHNQRKRLEDFFCDFDWNRLERSPTYIPEYCISRLVKWYVYATMPELKRAMAGLLIQAAKQFTDIIRSNPPK